jgi:hypothetical protein
MILDGIIAIHKYWATSMLKKEIPIEIRKIVGGKIEYNRNAFASDGSMSLSIDFVLIAIIHTIVSVNPVKTKTTA